MSRSATVYRRSDVVFFWLRKDRSHWIGLSGGLVLMLYGVIPTLQPEHNFGRIYAAYGGIFAVISLLWDWLVDRKTPDTFDIVGAAICCLGIAVIMWWPRG